MENRTNLEILDFSIKLPKYITKSFYNSLKTKGFVILAGLSGTGKTKIFEEFVKCFPSLERNRIEKWIVIKETGEKLIPVKKETIEFNNGDIHINSLIKSINDSLGATSNRKVVIKLKNYYTELVPAIEKLRNYTNLISSEGITNHLAVYCFFIWIWNNRKKWYGEIKTEKTR